MRRIAWSGAATIALLWLLAGCGGSGTEATSGSQSAPRRPVSDHISARNHFIQFPHPGKRVPGRSLCDRATVSVGSHPAILNVDARCYAPAKGGRGNIVISRYVIGQPLHVTPILLWSHPLVSERGDGVRPRGNCKKMAMAASCDAPIAGPSQFRVRLLVNPKTRCNGVSIISITGTPCPERGLCTLPEFIYQIFHGRPKGC